MTLVSNPQSGSYTLVLSDADKVIDVTSSSPTTVTVPSDASVAFPVGTTLEVCQAGTGQVTIAGAQVANVLASDSFTRANSSTTLGSTEVGGLAWQAITVGSGPPSGTLGISSNQAYAPSPNVNGSIAYVATSTADVTVSCKLATAAGARLYLRGAAAQAGDNYLFLGGDTSLDLYQIVNGSWTLLSGTSGNGAGPANGDTISVTANGSSITVKKNGTTVYTLTVTTHQTNVRHGIMTNQATSRFDDFSVTAVASSPLPVRERQNRLKTAGQYAYATLRKVGTDEWHVAGDVAA